MPPFDWLKVKDNRDAALAVVTIFTAVAGGGWFLWDRFSGGDSGASPKPAISVTDNDGPVGVQTGSGTQIVMGDDGQVIMADPEKVTKAAPPEPIVTMTLAQFEERHRHLKSQITTELEQAHGEERERLEGELAEVSRRLADLPIAYEEAKARIAALERQLAELRGQVPDNLLAEAQEALAAGDTTKADALFAGVEAKQGQAIETAAAAAFARGEIAESEIRWADAALHYARAADLSPNFSRLFAAREFAWRTGDLESAFRFGRDLLDKAVNGEDMPESAFATALNEHANTLAALGRYEEAGGLYIQALERTRASMGENNLPFALRLNNLAELYRLTGRYDEAEPLFREAIDVLRSLSVLESPTYTSALNNLALLLLATARPDEAETLLLESLEVDRKMFGEVHPQIAKDLHNLGGAYVSTGRYEEAERHFRQAEKMSRQTLGEGHPDYAIRLVGLAAAVREQGKLAEAEKLYRQALKITEDTLGDDHPNYAARLSNLAKLLTELDRWDEAEPLFSKASEINRRAFGDQHLQYARSLNELGATLAATGRQQEAEALIRRALDIVEASLGRQHPTTELVRQNLNSVLADGPD